MVNADKHRKLLNDYETRVKKQIIRQQLISDNSRKIEERGNQYLYTSGGRAGRNSIVETDEKRVKANNEFKRIVKQNGGLNYGFDKRT